MKPDTKRMGQVSDMIARNLSMMFVDPGFVRDPRLGNITITEVEVSRDIGKARVYYVLPEDVDQKEVDGILRKAAGFLRTSLSERLALRMVPTLQFIYDTSIMRAAKIQKLLDEAEPSEKDEEE